MSISSLGLEAFYAVVQTSNFTRAADRLGVTQSALSHRLQNLESDLETTLLIRDRAGLRLTQAGHSLLKYCQAKEGLEREFLTGLKAVNGSTELSGIVRIAGFSSVMRSVALPSLNALLIKNPEVQIEFLTREMRDLLPHLKRGEVDFILSEDNFEREEIESTLLGIEKNVLVEKIGYKGPEIYLDHDEDDRTTMNYLKLLKKKMAPVRRRYLDDVYGLLDGVGQGLGRAVLPRHLIANCKNLEILNPRTALELSVNLHHFRQPYYSNLHKAVVHALVENVPDLLNA